MMGCLQIQMAGPTVDAPSIVTLVLLAGNGCLHVHVGSEKAPTTCTSLRNWHVAPLVDLLDASEAALIFIIRVPDYR